MFAIAPISFVQPGPNLAWTYS